MSPIIQVRINKTIYRPKEIIIDWEDGAVTELNAYHTGILHGKNGVDVRVKRGDQHELACEKEIQQQGYSFRRR